MTGLLITLMRKGVEPADAALMAALIDEQLEREMRTVVDSAQKPRGQQWLK